MAKARVRALLWAVGRVLGVGPGTLLVSYDEEGTPVSVEQRKRWLSKDLDELPPANVVSIVEEDRP